MRVLLDECLPKQLKEEFVVHDVSTVPEMGWAGKKNGELLRLAAETKFDIFLTADQNITYQQNLQKAQLGMIVLVTPNNRLDSFKKLMPKVLKILQKGFVEGLILID